jgi:hypothetical protein
MFPILSDYFSSARVFKNITPSESISANRKTATAKCIMIAVFMIDNFG